MSDAIFDIADQINYGIDGLVNPDLRCEISKLNVLAGIKAGVCSDYVTSRSYLRNALKLLPKNHWECDYDESLRLYVLLARSAYCCRDREGACNTLQHVFDHANCLGDKLDAYRLRVFIYANKGQVEEAYMSTRDVLKQLGEEIPESISTKETREMLQRTSSMLSDAPKASLLGADWNMERNIEFILEFYQHLFIIAYSAMPEYVPFFACRMVQLSMKHGSSKYSIMSKFEFYIDLYIVSLARYLCCLTSFCAFHINKVTFSSQL